MYRLLEDLAFGRHLLSLFYIAIYFWGLEIALLSVLLLVYRSIF